MKNVCYFKNNIIKNKNFAYQISVHCFTSRLLWTRCLNVMEGVFTLSKFKINSNSMFIMLTLYQKMGCKSLIFFIVYLLLYLMSWNRKIKAKVYYSAGQISDWTNTYWDNFSGIYWSRIDHVKWSWFFTTST